MLVICIPKHLDGIGLIVMNCTIDFKHHLHHFGLLCLRKLLFSSSREFNNFPVALLSINDLVELTITCSNMFSFCFFMLDFLFWFTTLITSFDRVLASARWFTVSKKGSIMLLRSEDSLLTTKGNSMSNYFW